MKFVATEEIAAPIDRVWARVSDAERFEARLGDAERVPPGPVGPGTRWIASAEMMGKRRRLEAVLERMAVPEALALEVVSDGVAATVLVELSARGPERTCLTVTTEARARSLGAKVALQSAKLMREQLATRYRARLAEFAENVAAEYAAVG